MTEDLYYFPDPALFIICEYIYDEDPIKEICMLCSKSQTFVKEIEFIYILHTVNERQKEKVRNLRIGSYDRCDIKEYPNLLYLKYEGESIIEMLNKKMIPDLYKLNMLPLDNDSDESDYDTEYIVDHLPKIDFIYVPSNVKLSKKIPNLIRIGYLTYNTNSL